MGVSFQRCSKLAADKSGCWQLIFNPGMEQHYGSRLFDLAAMTLEHFSDALDIHCVGLLVK
jgi:hypothetical protein